MFTSDLSPFQELDHNRLSAIPYIVVVQRRPIYTLETYCNDQPFATRSCVLALRIFVFIPSGTVKAFSRVDSTQHGTSVVSLKVHFPSSHYSVSIQPQSVRISQYAPSSLKHFLIITPFSVFFRPTGHIKVFHLNINRMFTLPVKHLDSGLAHNCACV